MMNGMKGIAVIGLGYVGLPLAVEFGKKRRVFGFDINKTRIGQLINGIDLTGEVSSDELRESRMLQFSSNPSDLSEAQIYVITVPTPIDIYKKPDLRPLINASEQVGNHISKGDIVIYESTVFPGCTEEVCVPILEETSGLKFNVDFFCGYSPERINPGDKEHRVTNILKVTSGSTPQIAQEVDELYKSVITAGTHLASSIRVAEAAKVIENSQRDLNIAFVNELSLIFGKMGIDTHEVLEAAGTKWNFLSFKPGLVGGHCIGVDPYYLTYKAESLGYHPHVILAGRRINDGMGEHVANKVIQLLAKSGRPVAGAKALILGITFKENCPDIRNSRVIDVIDSLREFNVEIDVYDPWASTSEVELEYNINLKPKIVLEQYDAVVHAVAHNEFQLINWDELGAGAVLFDVKGSLDINYVTARL